MSQGSRWSVPCDWCVRHEWNGAEWTRGQSCWALCAQHTARAEFPVAVPPVHCSVLGCHLLLICPMCGSVWGALQLPLPAVSLGLDVIPHGGHVFPGFREVGVPMVEMSCWSLGKGLWDSSGPLF